MELAGQLEANMSTKMSREEEVITWSHLWLGVAKAVNKKITVF